MQVTNFIKFTFKSLKPRFFSKFSRKAPYNLQNNSSCLFKSVTTLFSISQGSAIYCPKRKVYGQR